MPHFGFTSPWSWLSYRVGRLFGAGVTGLVTEFRHLSERSIVSSRAEKFGWVFRSVTSGVLVGVGGWLCLRLLSVGIVQTTMASEISCAGLFVLPKHPHSLTL